MSTESAEAVPHPDSTGNTIVEHEDVVIKDPTYAANDSNGPNQSPPGNDEHMLPLLPSNSESESGNAVVNGQKGPLEGRLRQRTPGIDYLRIGNPQARGSRSKPTYKSDLPASPLLGNLPISLNVGNPQDASGS